MSKYKYYDITNTATDSEGTPINLPEAVERLNACETSKALQEYQIDKRRDSAQVKLLQKLEALRDAADVFFASGGYSLQRASPAFRAMHEAYKDCTRRTADQLRDEAFEAADKAMAVRCSLSDEHAQAYIKAKAAYDKAVKSESVDDVLRGDRDYESVIIDGSGIL